MKKKSKFIMPIILVLLVTTVFASTKSVTGNELVLLVGSSQAIHNGEELLILNDNEEIVSTMLIDGKTFVPISFIEEKMNIKISTVKAKIISILGTEYMPIRDISDNYNLSLYYEDGVIILKNKEITTSDKGKIKEYKNKLSTIPNIKNKEDLKNLLNIDKDNYLESYYLAAIREYGALSSPKAEAKEESVSESVSVESEPMDSSNDYSQTNVQVQGVDEGDIVKTDGKYIYTAKENLVNIVKAYPANDMKLNKTLEYGENDSVLEMILNDGQLIVIVNSYEPFVPEELSKKEPPENVLILDMPSYGGTEKVEVYIYDIKDINNPKEIKKVSIDGSFKDSRKVGNELYFIVGTYINYDYEKDDFNMPIIKDSAAGTERKIAYDTIKYFPENIKFYSYSLDNIIGVKLDDIKKEASIQTYLGGGDSIYMSQKNLYIATFDYSYSSQNNSYISTNIYKFGLNNATVDFKAKASVEGGILNQFSMDEHNDYFRIATTINTRTGVYNAMYVLDKNLNKTGEIENIAPRETIHSVRFMGDKAYMVTFELTDPLFVIDLKDPYNPSILGELKIPGYSNYLHPYDENHLIGFGKDTFEKDGVAYDKGMKISMFDVSDINNPKEKFVSYIGDRGTNSELLYNHKALLFSKEKNILAFPVEVYKLPKASKKDEPFTYGDMEFQGAYIYSIDMNEGFVLKDTISHMDSSNEIYNTNSYVNRALYIKDVLYTISNKKVQANNLGDLKYIDNIILK